MGPLSDFLTGVWRQVTHGLRSLLRRGDEERELHEEVTHWMREAEADLVAGGLPADEARRGVRLRHGDPLAAREDVRGYGWRRAASSLSPNFPLSPGDSYAYCHSQLSSGRLSVGGRWMFGHPVDHLHASDIRCRPTNHDRVPS